MARLPLLPGYNFCDPAERQKPIRQSLGWKKGAPIVDVAPVSIFSEADKQELLRSELRLQYGMRSRAKTPPKFLPEWAVLEKKVLRFKGYFTEHVTCGSQVYRVRPVLICYYLVDDAMAVTEPRTVNSGLDQGRLMSRQRVPHPDGGFWHWKHLNLGKTISLYGRNYIICDCDAFTKEYLLSEGTELGNSQPIPSDPYSLLRQSRADSPTRKSDLRPRSAPSLPSGLKGLVLRFDVMLEEMEGSQPTASPAVLLYRPEDLTVELRQPSHFHYTEIKKFSCIILRPTKVPLGDIMKAAVLNIGEEGEVGEWLMPCHLTPPANLTIFGRRVLVTGCDSQTQIYLQNHYGIDNIPAMKAPESTKSNESGSSGKTRSDIVPRPKTSCGLLNAENVAVLRFSAKLDSPLEEEGDRSFILTYYMVDATVELIEKEKPGGLGGRVLSRTRVPKPKPHADEKRAGLHSSHDFYTLDDFFIGAVLSIWGRRYIITGADRYVLNYVRDQKDKVSPQLLSSVFTFFGNDTAKEEKTDEKH